MGLEVDRPRRARILLAIAVVVIGGCIALVVWQHPPASIWAGVAAALGFLLLSGIVEPFAMMLVGNGRNPFGPRRGRDTDLMPVAPRSGPPPEPGMWGRDAVFGELARLVEEDGDQLEVLRTRGRVRVARVGASPPIACDLVVIGHQLLEHLEVGDPDALRTSMHRVIDRMIATTHWQVRSF